MVSTAAFHARVRGSVLDLGGLKGTKNVCSPSTCESIVGSLRDREVAFSASDRQGSNFESCVWRTVSSQSSHHSRRVLLAQFSLYVHKGGLKPDAFHFISTSIIKHFQHVIYNQVTNHFVSNNLHCECQYGFHKNTTRLAVLNVVESQTEWS